MGQAAFPTPADASGAEVIRTHSPELFAAAVQRAANLLRAGDVVVIPTETVYGLAANAREAAAVARIFQVKGRPAHNPIIVHIAGIDMAKACVSGWPAAADRLAAAFWPGPLTLVLPKSALIPANVTAGGNTVGIRWPSHPFVQALIRTCHFPLAAPSANRSNQVSPTTAEHVRRSLGEAVPLIVDGGACQVGLESTVVDLTTSPARILRPGMVTAAALEAVLGPLAPSPGAPEPGPLRSPGQLTRHYAPKATLRVWTWNRGEDIRARLLQASLAPETVAVIAHTHLPSPAGLARVSVIPHDPEAFARALYAELHHCDEEGARWILVEEVPSTPAWAAIRDRLARASS